MLAVESESAPETPAAHAWPTRICTLSPFRPAALVSGSTHRSSASQTSRSPLTAPGTRPTLRSIRRCSGSYARTSDSSESHSSRRGCCMTNDSSRTVSRRQFLQTTGVAGTGLLIGFTLHGGGSGKKSSSGASFSAACPATPLATAQCVVAHFPG